MCREHLTPGTLRIMFYTVYKITNKINGKIYIGKHKTTDLDDGYFGSGKIIKRAINKHGIDNFIKEYIEIFDNEEDMNRLETKIIDPTFVANSSTYNIKLGGVGGFDYVNNNKLNMYENHADNIKKWADLGRKNAQEKFAANSVYREIVSERLSTNRKEYQSKYGNPFKGRTHSSTTKLIIGQKNSKSQSGEKNSQFGTCWITDGKVNKKIKKDNLEFWTAQGFYKGRI